MSGKAVKVVFEEVVFRGRIGRCRDCGKRMSRTRKFSQTINPFNRNADGTPKDFLTILSELRRDAEKWCVEGASCRGCAS